MAKANTTRVAANPTEKIESVGVSRGYSTSLLLKHHGNSQRILDAADAHRGSWFSCLYSRWPYSSWPRTLSAPACSHYLPR